MGDVTGNWIPAPSLGSLESLESLESRKSDREDVANAIGFELPPTELKIPGIRSLWSDKVGRKRLGENVIEIPVSIGSANGILAYDAVITYDADILEPVIERPVESNGTLSTNFNVVVNRSEPGKLRLAAYGIAPVTGDGDLIILRFRVKRPNAKIDDAKLEFESLVINEKSVISGLVWR